MECDVHKIEFSLVCVTCENKFLCAECFDDHPRDHRVSSIKSVTKRMKNEKQNLLRSIDEDVSTLKKEIAAVRATQKQQGGLETEENQKINDQRAAFHSIIDQLADSQLQFSGTQKMKNIKVLQEDEAFLTKQLQERLAYEKAVKHIIDSADEIEMLQKTTEMMPLSFPPTPLQPLKFCPGNINEDQIRFMFGRMTDSPEEVEVVSDFVGSIYLKSPDTDDSKKQVIESKLTEQAKNKIDLGLGRIQQTDKRRNRKFYTKPQQPIANNDGEEKLEDLGPSSFTPQVLDLKNVVEFKTKEGLDIKIYVGSILHLDVDCIVNAANEILQHGGGIAHVISQAAGYEFDRESRDFIIQNGPLNVGECCTTTAGRLRYKGVIHAVGPRWIPSDQYGCLRELKETITNTLLECDYQNFKSVAIPAISSGIFGVPKELCASEYYRGVEEYSTQRTKPYSLREVHFVDKDPGMVYLIHQPFAISLGMTCDSWQTQSVQSIGSKSFSATSQNRKTSFRDRSYSQDIERDENYFEANVRTSLDTDGFYTFDNMGVDVVCGDITSIPADAVVSPEDIQCSGHGHIAKAITDKTGKSFESLDKPVAQRKQKLSVMDVFPTHAGDAKWYHILHTIVPVWKDYNKNSEKFRQDVKTTYLNIFNKMETLNIQDIAVPVIGADSSSVPVTVLAEGLYSACKEYSQVSKQRYLKIIIASMDIKLVNGLCYHMNDLEGGKSDDGSTSIKQSGGTQETCCICMDEMTDPKKLRCGHVFCKDCIEQCFEFKPMCPNCGAIYGKIIGDQPDGTIHITKSRFDHLPGYEKDGVITVSYNFPGGVQGENHPNPGRRYEGIARSGYLPNNKRGKLVSKLLKIAFNRKLVFTIGSSRTTGEEGVVTWNNINHKTRKDGGPQRLGYPDPTYLDRVMEELAVKGVTEESLKDP